jgi:hypothetical protein
LPPPASGDGGNRAGAPSHHQAKPMAMAVAA